MEEELYTELNANNIAVDKVIYLKRKSFDGAQDKLPVTIVIMHGTHAGHRQSH